MTPQILAKEEIKMKLIIDDVTINSTIRQDLINAPAKIYNEVTTTIFAYSLRILSRKNFNRKWRFHINFGTMIGGIVFFEAVNFGNESARECLERLTKEIAVQIFNLQNV